MMRVNFSSPGSRSPIPILMNIARGSRQREFYVFELEQNRPFS